MAISKHKEKPSRRPVVRTRRQGTAIQDHRVPETYETDIKRPEVTRVGDYLDIQVDNSGNAVSGAFDGQGT